MIGSHLARRHQMTAHEYLIKFKVPWGLPHNAFAPDDYKELQKSLLSIERIEHMTALSYDSSNRTDMSYRAAAQKQHETKSLRPRSNNGTISR